MLCVSPVPFNNHLHAPPQLWDGAEGHGQLWVPPPSRPDHPDRRGDVGLPHGRRQADRAGVRTPELIVAMKIYSLLLYLTLYQGK